MATPKRTRNWRLHFLGANKKTYILDNLDFEYFASKEENGSKLRFTFRDFTRPDLTDIEAQDLPRAKDLNEYAKHIEANFAPNSRARNFAARLRIHSAKHSADSPCYLRMITEKEHDQMVAAADARSKKHWEKPRPCQICSRAGRIRVSPWGTPAILTLCTKHYSLLILDSPSYRLLSLITGSTLVALTLASTIRPIASVTIVIALAIPWRIRFWQIP